MDGNILLDEVEKASDVFKYSVAGVRMMVSKYIGDNNRGERLYFLQYGYEGIFNGLY